MARTRNIKPSFFTNEYMAENDPLGRLLFLGMLTLADFKGDLEWRPKRIKVQILPYDDCDLEQLAKNLDKSGFIRFYSDGKKTYVHIDGFVKHQNPHKNEKAKGSDIPEYSESMRQLIDLSTLTIKPEKIASTPEQYETDPALNLKPYPSKKLSLSARAREEVVDNPQTLIPDDYQPPPDMEARLLRAGRTDIDPTDPTLLTKFIAHHQGKGTTSANWDAMYLAWCLRERKSGGHDNGETDRRSRTKRVADKLDEIARRDIEENGLPEVLG